ncbi:uncharacterized protein A4U43_C02F8010 [Asparagus officinalis]|uniref:Uncharacterized protein n=1 Tax=Asparagus officinalis TaxID=4686 RepID=A0A5P1FIP6_ASPOF|nr:uncharacterized protein A4U43_C02F8010 [Asparagus officinalis]
MAGSMRAELASSSLNGISFASVHPNGQRGNYSTSNLDRSGSSRESIENRMMVSGQIGSRNAETVPVSQYMSLEPFPINGLRNVRSGELRRVLGISVEDHPFGSLQSKPLPPVSWDELKRFRRCIDENHSRAEERSELLQNSIVKLDKLRNIVMKKRQRTDMQSNEKSSNSSLLKVGNQMHQNPSDLEDQRPEERTKSGNLSERVRSSMADARVSLPYSLQQEGRNTIAVRQGTLIDKDKIIHVDKDKSMLRACNGFPVSADDKMHGLAAGGEGWDKRNKRKRSVGTMVYRTSLDGDREIKKAIQQKPSNEPRPRSGDGLGFRTGLSNGIIGSNKMDEISQMTGHGSRIMPRNDSGNGRLSSDRKEYSSVLDKEQVTAKGSKKLNICEDAQVGSQRPSAKGKAVRAPRSGSSIVINMPNLPCPPEDGSEQPSCSNKVQSFSGSSNRKRPLSAGSSSPPVAARWGGQRREKISRTRRANVVSPVSNIDDSEAEGSAGLDFVARLSNIDSRGVLVSRGIPNDTLLNIKLENVPSPSTPSESEESVAVESKSKERGHDNGEFEDGALNAYHKAATFVLTRKKNKVPPREEIGDGVRRQVRSGRGSIQSKACLQSSNGKLESSESAKPLKSGRLVSDKSERLCSRIGRPPSKKISDRKISARPLPIINNGSSKFTGECNDDLEELLAAAKYVRDAYWLQKSGPFWAKVEPIFASVSSEDSSLLRHQINFAEELDRSFSNMFDISYNVVEDMYQVVPHDMSQPASQTNFVGLTKSEGTRRSADESRPVKATPGEIDTERWFERVIPLSQRLLSALISEEGTNMADCNSKQEDTFLQFSSDCCPYEIASFGENKPGYDLTKCGSEFDNDLRSQTNCYGDNTSCNGFVSPSTTFRSLSNFISENELFQDKNELVHPDNEGVISLCKFEQDNLKQQEIMDTSLPGMSSHQCQYVHMSLDDKILMELHSIGIYPDAEPDLAKGSSHEIDKAVSELKIRLYQQVQNTKNQLCKLEKVIQEQKESEMRNLERLAMDQLVILAHGKLVGGRGTRGSGPKSGANKISKQLADAFAKRILTICKKFEETGQSYFSELPLRDVLLSKPVLNIDNKSVHGLTTETTPSMNVDSLSSQVGSCVSASGVSSNMIERHGPIHKIDKSQLDPYYGLTQPSEQVFVRNDNMSNRGKKNEVLLDDVVIGVSGSKAMPAVNALPGGVKLKKTDKDQNGDMLIKNSPPKGSHSTLSIAKGERKTKAKPKQKIAQLSNSGNGLGRVMETTNRLHSMRESCENVNAGNTKMKTEVELAPSPKAQDLSKLDVQSDVHWQFLSLMGITK